MKSHKSEHPQMHKPHCLGRTRLGDCKGCLGVTDAPPEPEEALDLMLIVNMLCESFQVLANEGLIPQDRVLERARNQACIVQMIVEDALEEATKDDSHKLALEVSAKDALDIALGYSSELTKLQTSRGDANAKAYDEAKKEIEQLSDLLTAERKERRVLHTKLTNLDSEFTGKKRAINNLEIELGKKRGQLHNANRSLEELEKKLSAIVFDFKDRAMDRQHVVAITQCLKCSRAINVIERVYPSPCGADICGDCYAEG